MHFTFVGSLFAKFRQLQDITVVVLKQRPDEDNGK